MPAVVSRDGTRIAYDRRGHGHPVVLVLGIFNDRSAGSALADYLAHHFTVYNYDRRGRGQSGDAPDYSIEREVDDLEAVIHRAGHTVAVFGYSTGAIVTLRAARRSGNINHLALYEPAPSGGRAPILAPELVRLILAGRRAAAVELFQRDALGMSPEAIARMSTIRPPVDLEKMAHTLVYESSLLEALPRDLLSSVRVPTLVVDGDQSPAAVRQAAKAIARGIHDASYQALKGQGDEIAPEALGPVLSEFFHRHFTGTKPGPEGGRWPFGGLRRGHVLRPGPR